MCPTAKRTESACYSRASKSPKTRKRLSDLQKKRWRAPPPRPRMVTELRPKAPPPHPRVGLHGAKFRLWFAHWYMEVSGGGELDMTYLRVPCSLALLALV